MTIPALSFFIGAIILAYNLFFIQKKSIFPPITKYLNPNLKIYFIIGNILIAIALMLGLVGYFSLIPGGTLRMIRLGLGILGLLCLVSSTQIANKIIQNKQRVKYSVTIITYALTFLAGAVLVSLSLIAFFDASYGGDGFWYHLPFAGRIWGIIPPEVYTFEEILEYRYLGLPLLANFFQGFFWFIFGRPETANLTCYFSLIILIAYLRFYLKIPFYLATISLLAVPMVHMHATRMYIDLPANAFAAIVILTVYMVALKNFEANKYDLGIIFGAATMATNMKFQMTPIIFMMISVLLVAWLVKIWRKQNISIDSKLTKSFQTTVIVFLASLIVFFSCVKNIVVYQNPFYPMKLEIAGVVLNHAEENQDVMHDDLRKYHTTIRWARSLLEIGAFDERRPWPWSLGMDYIGRHERTFGVGGYFGGYVVFNLLVLAYISWRFWGKETKYALLFFLPISLFTSYLPEAYKLRYYMYWMIVLVSLNTYFCTYFSQKFKTKIIKPLYFALVATGFMFIFMDATRFWFTKPQFSSFDKQLQRTDIINQELLTEIKNGEQGKDICLIEKTQFGILYTSYFHPDRKHDYSITAEFNRPEKIERRCKGKTIVK